MSALQLLAIGIPVTLLFAWVIATWQMERRPASAPARPIAAATVSTLEPTPDIMRIVQFLQAEENAAKVAGEVCFRAMQCGYISPSGANGTVKSPLEMGRCVAERSESCDVAVLALGLAKPPASIAKAWIEWTSHERQRREIGTLIEILKVVKVPRRTRSGS